MKRPIPADVLKRIPETIEAIVWVDIEDDSEGIPDDKAQCPAAITFGHVARADKDMVVVHTTRWPSPHHNERTKIPRGCVIKRVKYRRVR